MREETRWVWQELRRCEAAWRALPAGAPGREAAWRQLALLQASDWPFMIARDQAAAYAAERVRTHVARFEAACRASTSTTSPGTTAPPTGAAPHIATARLIQPNLDRDEEG